MLTRSSRLFARTIRAVIAALFLFASLGLAATPWSAAQAESIIVMPRDKLVEMLGKRFHEYPVERGLDNRGMLIEVFTTSNGETWTIVRTSPQGLSRVLGTGQHWAMQPRIAGELF